jgi:hypothetical protein
VKGFSAPCVNQEFRSVLEGFMSGVDIESAQQLYHEMLERDPAGGLMSLMKEASVSGRLTSMALVLIGKWFSWQGTVAEATLGSGLLWQVQTSLLEFLVSEHLSNEQCQLLVSAVHEMSRCCPNSPIVSDLVKFCRHHPSPAIIDCLAVCIRDVNDVCQLPIDFFSILLKEFLTQPDASSTPATLCLVYSILEFPEEMYTFHSYLLGIPAILVELKQSPAVLRILSNLCNFLSSRVNFVPLLGEELCEVIIPFVQDRFLCEGVRTYSLFILNLIVTECPEIFVQEEKYLAVFDLAVSLYNELPDVDDLIVSMCTVFAGNVQFAVHFAEVFLGFGGLSEIGFRVFQLGFEAWSVNLWGGWSETLIPMFQTGFRCDDISVKIAALKGFGKILELAMGDFDVSIVLKEVISAIPRVVNWNSDLLEEIFKTFVRACKCKLEMESGLLLEILQVVDLFFRNGIFRPRLFRCCQLIAKKNRTTKIIVGVLFEILGKGGSHELVFPALRTAPQVMRAISHPHLREQLKSIILTCLTSVGPDLSFWETEIVVKTMVKMKEQCHASGFLDFCLNVASHPLEKVVVSARLMDRMSLSTEIVIYVESCAHLFDADVIKHICTGLRGCCSMVNYELSHETFARIVELSVRLLSDDLSACTLYWNCKLIRRTILAFCDVAGAEVLLDSCIRWGNETALEYTNIKSVFSTISALLPFVRDKRISEILSLADLWFNKMSAQRIRESDRINALDDVRDATTFEEEDQFIVALVRACIKNAEDCDSIVRDFVIERMSQDSQQIEAEGVLVILADYLTYDEHIDNEMLWAVQEFNLKHLSNCSVICRIRAIETLGVFIASGKFGIDLCSDWIQISSHILKENEGTETYKLFRSPVAFALLLSLRIFQRSGRLNEVIEQLRLALDCDVVFPPYFRDLTSNAACF